MFLNQEEFYLDFETKHLYPAPVKKEPLQEQMERWGTSKTAKPPPHAMSGTLGQAWSITCLQAFPVCCSHGSGLIRSAFRASGSQSCDSNADYSDLRSGAAAGGLRAGWIQSKKKKTVKKNRTSTHWGEIKIVHYFCTRDFFLVAHI